MADEFEERDLSTARKLKPNQRIKMVREFPFFGDSSINVKLQEKHKFYWKTLREAQYKMFLRHLEHNSPEAVYAYMVDLLIDLSETHERTVQNMDVTNNKKVLFKNLIKGK